MARSRPPYPPEFRQRIIELVRKGRMRESLAEQFEPTAESIPTGWPRPIATLGSARMASDNALCESFFATFEWAEARLAAFDCIEGWYNPHRRVQTMSRRSATNNCTQSSRSAKPGHPPRNRGNCAIVIHVAHAPLRGSACCLTTPAPRSRMLKGARQPGPMLYTGAFWAIGANLRGNRECQRRPRASQPDWCNTHLTYRCPPLGHRTRDVRTQIWMTS
jgi:hypothetical protein